MDDRSGIQADDRLSMAARIERAVRDVFEKRYIGKLMPYQEARETVWLERELVAELVHRICPEDRRP